MIQVANDNASLRFLSVCSGIEAASVAWPQWQAVAFSEIEKFPSAVLAHHYPDVPNLGDFTKIDTTSLGQVDILCGGTPCQAFSVAGLRRSLDDARGNLSLAFVELAHELAGLGSPNGRATSGNGLRNAVWENVVGVLSTKDNAFGCFLAGLVGADAAIVPPGGRKWTRHGMVAGPKGRAAWAVKDAQFYGVAQRRRRVIVVADFGDGADPAAVLFEPESVCRHSPPSRETGEGTSTYSASSIGSYRDAEVSGADRAAGGDNGGGSENLVAATLTATYGEQSGQDMMADNMLVHVPEIARCVATREGSSQDYESTTMVAVATLDGQDVARTLSARHDGSPCADRGPNVICFTAKDYGGDAAYDIAPTLRAGTHSGSHANAGVMPAVTVALRGREGGATAELGGEVATALRASSGGGDKPHVLAFNTSGYGAAVDEQVASTMQASYDKLSNQVYGAVVNSAVRRLTPVECERLQGFPDNYTAIPWRGKPAEQCPDGPRYKALGNSWAVPLFTWLGRRIEMHMPPVAHNDNTAATKQEAA